jgi:hypothetical protein
MAVQNTCITSHPLFYRIGGLYCKRPSCDWWSELTTLYMLLHTGSEKLGLGVLKELFIDRDSRFSA